MECGILVMKQGKMVHNEGIQIASGERTKAIDADNKCQYLDILESVGIAMTEMIYV